MAYRPLMVAHQSTKPAVHGQYGSRRSDSLTITVPRHQRLWLPGWWYWCDRW